MYCVKERSTVSKAVCLCCSLLHLSRSESEEEEDDPQHGRSDGADQYQQTGSHQAGQTTAGAPRSGKEQSYSQGQEDQISYWSVHFIGNPIQLFHYFLLPIPSSGIKVWIVSKFLILHSILRL